MFLNLMPIQHLLIIPHNKRWLVFKTLPPVSVAGKSSRFVRCVVQVLTHAACAGSVCVVFCVPAGAELVPPSALITAASVFA